MTGSVSRGQSLGSQSREEVSGDFDIAVERRGVAHEERGIVWSNRASVLQIFDCAPGPFARL
jgi:hypothetical protein